MVMQSYISYISIYNESVKSKIHYKFKSIFFFGWLFSPVKRGNGNVAMETSHLWRHKGRKDVFLFYPIDSPAMLSYIYEKNIYG